MAGVETESGMIGISQENTGFVTEPGGAEVDKPQEECGVLAFYVPSDIDNPVVLQRTMDGLTALQHRGHSGAGVAYPFAGLSVIHKGRGAVPMAVKELVSRPDGFNLPNFDGIVRPRWSVGHVRYSTADSEDFDASQPFKYQDVILAHNGEISNTAKVGAMFGIPAEEITDSANIAHIIGERTAYHDGDLATVLREVLPHFEGAYCLTGSHDEHVFAARDAWGFHPLALGELEDGGHVVASESVAFEAMGAKFVRDIEPGEIVIIDDDGIHSSFIERQEKPAHCMFEYIYTAREDGEIDGTPVGRARELMGRNLAADHPVVGADFVVPVPNTARRFAEGYSEESAQPIFEAVTKKHSTRTFQMRGADRAQMIDSIYDFKEASLVDKSVVLIDDSMIKGSTMAAFVKQFVERTGVAEVHLRFAAPEYLFPCYMGMDTHDTSRLISRRLTPKEIADELGVASVAFNEPHRVEEAIREASTRGLGGLCMACVTGEYPVQLPDGVAEGLDLPRKRALGSLFTARP